MLFENTPSFDGSIVYARELDPRKDQIVMQSYPDRRYYRAVYKSGEVTEIILEGDDPSRELPVRGPIDDTERGLGTRH